jgi:hypothetical protein
MTEWRKADKGEIAFQGTMRLDVNPRAGSLPDCFYCDWSITSLTTGMVLVGGSEFAASKQNTELIEKTKKLAATLACDIQQSIADEALRIAKAVGMNP